MIDGLRWMRMSAMAGLLCLYGTSSLGATSKVQVKLTPSGIAELIEQGDRTRVAITLPRAPGDQRIVATIYQGKCSDASKKAVFSFESPPGTDAPSSTAPLFEGLAPVSLAKLQGGPHSIDLATSAASGNRQIACGDIK